MKKKCNNCGQSKHNNPSGKTQCTGTLCNNNSEWVPIRDIRKGGASGKVLDCAYPEQPVVLASGNTKLKVGTIYTDDNHILNSHYIKLDYNEYKQYPPKEIVRYGKFAEGDKVIYRGEETNVISTKYTLEYPDNTNVLVQLKKGGHSGTGYMLDNNQFTSNLNLHNVYWVADNELTLIKGETKEMKYELIKELSLKAIYEYKDQVCSNEFGKIIDRFSNQYNFTQAIKWDGSIEEEIIKHSSWLDFLIANSFIQVIKPKIVFDRTKVYILNNSIGTYKLQQNYDHNNEKYFWASLASTDMSYNGKHSTGCVSHNKQQHSNYLQ